MEKETKHMTEEMKDQYNFALEMDAYVEACKSRIFIKKKTIVNAILASQAEWRKLWRLVASEWPESDGKVCTAYRNDYTVVIGGNR